MQTDRQWHGPTKYVISMRSQCQRLSTICEFVTHLFKPKRGCCVAYATVEIRRFMLLINLLQGCKRVCLHFVVTDALNIVTGHSL